MFLNNVILHLANLQFFLQIFMKNSQIRKILVIRFSSIGDIVLTTGVLRQIRAAFPYSKIDFLLHKPFSDIYKYNPNIDQIITCEKNATDSQISLQKNIIEKKQGKYDIIFDLHNNIQSNKFSQNLAEKIYKVDKRRLYKIKLVWCKKGINESYRHIHHIFLDILKDFDIKDDNRGLEFWLEADRKAMKYQPSDKIHRHKGKLNIVVAPGAHFKTKQWGFLNYAHLMRKLKPISESVKIVGGLKDSEHAQKILELNPDVINLCGKTDLATTCDEIDKSDLLITNDTGVMHIAAARQVPVVAIFGSSVKELGFEPFRVKNIVIESNQKCRPCSHIGRNFCPLLHFKCMRSITPDIAYNNIMQFVKSVYL